MAKHMFITSQNNWFAHCAKLTSLLALVVVLLQNYVQIAHFIPPVLEKIQHYSQAGLGILIFILTFTAWFSRKYLTLKPFSLCLILVLLLMINVFNGILLAKLHLKINALFFTLFINLLILCFSWWLGATKRPQAYTLPSEHYKKFRIGAWFGLIFIISQIALCTWSVISQS